MRPPYSPKTSMGVNCMATVMPTAVTLCERVSTSQSWAMRCIHVPDMARMFEIVNSRKLGTRSELKVSLHGERPAMTGIGSVGGKADVGGAVAVTKRSPWWLCMGDVMYGGARFNASRAALIPGVN